MLVLVGYRQPAGHSLLTPSLRGCSQDTKSNQTRILLGRLAGRRKAEESAQPHLAEALTVCRWNLTQV